MNDRDAVAGPNILFAIACLFGCMFLSWRAGITAAETAARNSRILTAQATIDTNSPPAEFVGGVEVRVRFTTDADIMEICGDNAASCWDYQNARIVMPHPCYPNIDASDGRDVMRRLDVWRFIMCHEVGHVRGWMHH